MQSFRKLRMSILKINNSNNYLRASLGLSHTLDVGTFERVPRLVIQSSWNKRKNID